MCHNYRDSKISKLNKSHLLDCNREKESRCFIIFTQMLITVVD